MHEPSFRLRFPGCPAFGLLHRPARRGRPGHRRGDQLDLILLPVQLGGDRDSDPGAAEGHSQVGPARRDLVGELVAVIGIVDRIDAVRSEVDNLVPEPDHIVGQRGLEVEGCVVRSDGDALGHARQLHVWLGAHPLGESRRFCHSLSTTRRRLACETALY